MPVLMYNSTPSLCLEHVEFVFQNISDCHLPCIVIIVVRLENTRLPHQNWRRATRIWRDRGESHSFLSGFHAYRLLPVSKFLSVLSFFLAHKKSVILALKNSIIMQAVINRRKKL